MKKIWGWWKAGFIALVPILLLYWFINWIWGWLITNGSAFTVTDITALNVVLFFVSILAAPLVIRLLLSFRFVRELGFALTAWIPLIGPLFTFFFGTGDSHRKPRVESFPEIWFPLNDGVWALGFVVNEEKLPDPHSKTGECADFLIVLWATTPGAWTGPLQVMKKSAVHFTGRTVKDTMVTAASFGFIYEQMPQKSKKTKAL